CATSSATACWCTRRCRRRWSTRPPRSPVTCSPPPASCPGGPSATARRWPRRGRPTTPATVPGRIPPRPPDRTFPGPVLPCDQRLVEPGGAIRRCGHDPGAHPLDHPAVGPAVVRPGAVLAVAPRPHLRRGLSLTAHVSDLPTLIPEETPMSSRRPVLGEDWAATITGLVLLLLVLAGVI